MCNQGELTLRLGRAQDLHLSCRSTKLGELRRAVAQRLGIDVESRGPWRDMVKSCAVALSSRLHAGSPASSSSEREEQAQPRGTKRARAPAADTAKDVPRSVKALRQLCIEGGYGPSLFADLPEDHAAYAAELATRLREAGAQFKGKHPTQAEIRAAKEAHLLKKELDGIDASNVLTSSARKRRRGARAAGTLAEQDLASGSESASSQSSGSAFDTEESD